MRLFLTEDLGSTDEDKCFNLVTEVTSLDFERNHMKGLIKCKCNRAVAPKHRSVHARLRCLMGQEKKPCISQTIIFM